MYKPQALSAMYKHALFLFAHLLLVHGAPKEGQTLSDYLWESTAETQQQALDSNYVYGVKERCLDPTNFAAYNVDDAAYLYYNAESMKIAAARSNDISVGAGKFLSSESTKWTSYWEGMAKDLHIANAEGIAMGEEVTAYINHIKSVAENEDLKPVYTILALTPCARLWPWLGQQLQDMGYSNFGVYTDWVNYMFDPTSTGYKEFQDLVDEAYRNGDITHEKALEIFTESIKSEVSFFNSVKRCKPVTQDGRKII